MDKPTTQLKQDHQILLTGKRGELQRVLREMMELMGEPWHGTIPASWNVKNYSTMDWKKFDEYHVNTIVLRQEIKDIEEMI